MTEDFDVDALKAAAMTQRSEAIQRAHAEYKTNMEAIERVARMRAMAAAESPSLAAAKLEIDALAESCGAVLQGPSARRGLEPTGDAP